MKYVLGLGTGVIIMSVIFFAVYTADASAEKETVYEAMTDEEIRQQAVRMGMVQLSDIPEAAPQAEITDTEIIGRALDLGMAFPAETEAISETNEETEGSAMPAESAEPEEPEETVTVEDASGFFVVDIPRGSGSTNVSRILAEAGVIEDAEEFNRFIVSQNRATALQFGRFEIPKGISHADLLAMIVRRQTAAQGPARAQSAPAATATPAANTAAPVVTETPAPETGAPGTETPVTQTPTAPPVTETPSAEPVETETPSPETAAPQTETPAPATRTPAELVTPLPTVAFGI